MTAFRIIHGELCGTNGSQGRRYVRSRMAHLYTKWYSRYAGDLSQPRETGLRQVTCISRMPLSSALPIVICKVYERQLRLYEHVARFLSEDSAHRILSCRDPRAWAKPFGPAPGPRWGVHSPHGCVRWSLIQGYGHGGPGICLGDGQM